MRGAAQAALRLALTGTLYSPSRETTQRIADHIANVDLRTNWANGVKNTLADAIAPNSGFNWWHKHVGTQFHKAYIKSEFKKVFDLAQTFLDDVTRFATRAEGKAPSTALQILWVSLWAEMARK